MLFSPPPKVASWSVCRCISVSIIAGGGVLKVCSLSLISENAIRNAGFLMFPSPSCKKHHPPTASCCLRVARQLLLSECFCPRRDGLRPAERSVLGKRSWAVLDEPGWMHSRHKSGCECCKDAEERRHFLHQRGTWTRNGSVQLRRENRMSQNYFNILINTRGKRMTQLLIFTKFYASMSL